MSGRSWRPETVGSAPLATCKKTGMNVTAPKRPKPTTNPIALVAEKTRFANRWSGSTGSRTRRSTSAHTTSRATPEAPRIAIGTDDHAYVVPPRLATSTSAVTAALSTSVPT